MGKRVHFQAFRLVDDSHVQNMAVLNLDYIISVEPHLESGIGSVIWCAEGHSFHVQEQAQDFMLLIEPSRQPEPEPEPKPRVNQPSLSIRTDEVMELIDDGMGYNARFSSTQAVSWWTDHLMSKHPEMSRMRVEGSIRNRLREMATAGRLNWHQRKPAVYSRMKPV